MALGATPRDVVGLVVQQGTLVVGIGAVLGSVSAFAAARATAGVLFGIDAGDLIGLGRSAGRAGRRRHHGPRSPRDARRSGGSVGGATCRMSRCTWRTGRLRHQTFEWHGKQGSVLPTTGFLGTRADAFMDLAIVFFILAPFLMAYALRLAARRRHREHRNLQASLLAAAIVAVLMLEISIPVRNRRGGLRRELAVRTADDSPSSSCTSRSPFRLSSGGAGSRSCRGGASPVRCPVPSAAGTASGASSPSWACAFPSATGTGMYVMGFAF